MSNETLFSKIIRREIPATIVYEDDEVLGFKDIAPQAPVHVLFIPKNEIIPTLDDLQPSQAHLIGKLALAAAEYARREGFAQDGYRIVMNCREDAGQTVFHAHVHVIPRYADQPGFTHLVNPVEVPEGELESVWRQVSEPS